VNRNQLIAKIRKLARKTETEFDVNKQKGNGSHYVVTFGTKWTTLQSDLNPGRIERALKQLDIDPADL